MSMDSGRKKTHETRCNTCKQPTALHEGTTIQVQKWRPSLHTRTTCHKCADAKQATRTINPTIKDKQAKDHLQRTIHLRNQYQLQRHKDYQQYYHYNKATIEAKRKRNAMTHNTTYQDDDQVIRDLLDSIAAQSEQPPQLMPITYQVQPIGKPTWNCSYQAVESTTNIKHIIDTVDIYTYWCKTCLTYACEHVSAVTSFIEQEHLKITSMLQAAEATKFAAPSECSECKGKAFIQLMPLNPDIFECKQCGHFNDGVKVSTE